MRKHKGEQADAIYCPVLGPFQKDTHNFQAVKKSFLRGVPLDKMSVVDADVNFAIKMKLDVELLSGSKVFGAGSQPGEPPVFLKHTFIDCKVQDSDFQVSTPRSCFSEPGPDRASVFEDPLIASYAATLRERAAGLSQRSRSTMATKDVLSEKKDSSLEESTTTMSKSFSCSHDEDDSSRIGHWAHPRGLVLIPIPRQKQSFDTVSSMSWWDDKDDSLSRKEDEISPRVTTVMVCNLPCKLSTAGLMMTIERLGFAGMYDEVHVPRGSKNFLGYGFIKFKEPEFVPRFADALSTYEFPGSSKRPYLKVALRQDLDVTRARTSGGKR